MMTSLHNNLYQIKKVKTEDGDGPKVKEEPEGPMDESGELHIKEEEPEY